LFFKGDRQSLLIAMDEASRTSPNSSIEVKHVWEDGDTVLTHSRVVKAAPSLTAIAVVHIFRFEGDHVVELWDLGQEIPKNCPNENGPFWLLSRQAPFRAIPQRVSERNEAGGAAGLVRCSSLRSGSVPAVRHVAASVDQSALGAREFTPAA